MSENNLVDSALNEQIATDEAEITDTANETAEQKKERDYKAEYYKLYGKLKAMEKKPSASKPSNNYDDYDPNQIDVAKKIAREEAQKTYEELRAQEISAQEAKNFYDAHPEAYRYEDEIEEFREKFPKKSYSRCYKMVTIDNEAEAPVKAEKPINKVSSKSVPAKTDADPTDKEAVNDAFRKLMGR